MKKLLIVLFLAGTSALAHAQSGLSFDIDGQRVHIAIPRHCDSGERCVSVSTSKPGDARDRGEEQQIDASKLRDIFSGFISKRSRRDDGDDDKAERSKPTPAKQSHELAGKPPIGSPATDATATVANTVPASSLALPAPGSLKPANAGPVTPASGPTGTAPIATTAPIAALASAAPSDPVTAAPPTLSVEPTEASPVGVWITQNHEGRVDIRPCGANFCGYVFDAQSQRDGEKVLIDMRAVKEKHWSGRVHDPKGGGTYEATMALKSQDALAIRGCAMGGLICRGQTWTRG